jgi:hypothetical protein
MDTDVSANLGRRERRRHGALLIDAPNVCTRVTLTVKEWLDWTARVMGVAKELVATREVIAVADWRLVPFEVQMGLFLAGARLAQAPSWRSTGTLKQSDDSWLMVEAGRQAARGQDIVLVGDDGDLLMAAREAYHQGRRVYLLRPGRKPSRVLDLFPWSAVVEVPLPDNGLASGNGPDAEATDDLLEFIRAVARLEQSKRLLTKTRLHEQLGSQFGDVAALIRTAERQGILVVSERQRADGVFVPTVELDRQHPGVQSALADTDAAGPAPAPLTPSYAC